MGILHTAKSNVKVQTSVTLNLLTVNLNKRVKMLVLTSPSLYLTRKRNVT